MLVGKIQELEIARVSDFGLYLKDDEGQEVLLPNRFTSLKDKVGDKKSVFIYHDSEDRLVATTEQPKITTGHVAYLKVVDKNPHGAFLDWGLSGKDLFLPNRNQIGGVVVGKSYIVLLYVDDITGRCVATEKIKSIINNTGVISLTQGRKVDVLVASESEIGYRCIVDSRYWGMLYKNQIFRPVHVGDSLEAYVSRVTEENRIDLSLQQRGLEEVKDNYGKLLELLEANNGFLPYDDSSSPEDIQWALRMSKKSFKRATGMLLKAGKVEFADGGIRLK